MPPLEQALHKDRAGFVDAPVQQMPRLTIPPPVNLPGQGTFWNTPSIRSPLPPFNAQIDSLRQFPDGTTDVPKRRVIPLPAALQNAGTSLTAKQLAALNSLVISGSSSGSSSGGGSSTTVSLTAKTVVYSSPLLAPGGVDSQTIVMAKSFQLIAAVASLPCCFRLYGSSASQGSDSSRPPDSPVAAEIANNMVIDGIFDTAPLNMTFQNIVGVNASSPQTTSMFITGINTGTSAASFSVTLVFLPLEQ